ncbi:hypothetical protein FB45DRAFT_1051455 [Roridomyces roridus]|uniref:AAA-ATPase-like domain-containing protein n=1 Tax=Roridomyces roridus TaxID=1738132 RepID=A0AAD7CG72_9AGAR|nr:hypothetical protein FB45DRAFT_1051455 [Roridomyces roridus]
MSMPIVNPEDHQALADRVKTTVEKPRFLFVLSEDEDEDERDCEHQRRAKRRRTLGFVSSNPLSLPRAEDDFSDSQTAFVDKTRVLFQLPKQFRYILLRPPSFGKTAFLSAMTQFYDVHGDGVLEDYFGASEPPADRGRSQHLCLCFKFWTLGYHLDSEGFAKRLRTELFISLNSFVVKYARELGLSQPHRYLASGGTEPLKTVLDLVKSRGETLFVGVDDYDNALLGATIPPPAELATEKTFITREEISRILDLQFWSPIKLACEDGVVSKLFVTGTLDLQTPVLRTLVVPVPNYLHSCCGFTEEEALNFGESILGYPLAAIDLTTRCGGYLFSPEEECDRVLHPQLVINHISALCSQWSKSRAFDMLTSVLDLLPVESGVSDAASLNGLVELIANGGIVDVEDRGPDFDGNAVLWGALYHAGALTRVHGSKSTLRLANPEALSLIHSRIDPLVRRRVTVLEEAGRKRFLDTLTDYELDQHQTLLDLLCKILADQTRRSLGKAREPTLRGLVELIMRNSPLVSCGPSKLPESTILPPADDATHVRVVGVHTDHVYRWEIKTLTLRGIWQAVNPNETEPSIEALRQLHEELCRDEEEKVLARLYRVWSDSLQRMETRLVGSFFEPEVEYAQIIAVGGARILRRAGFAELIVVP